MTQLNTLLPKELIKPSPDFTALSDSIGLHWWHYDFKEGKLILSKGLMKVLGHTPEEYDYTPSTAYKNVHPDDLRRNNQRLKHIIQGKGDNYEIIYRVKNPQGEWQWYFNRGRVNQRDEQGKPISLGGISIEISKNFKHLLSMLEDKEKFEFIFRSTNEAIILIELLDGKAGRVLDANKAAQDLFKRSEKDIMQPLPEEILQDKVIGRDGALMKDVLEKGFARIERKIEIGNETHWLEFSVLAFTLTGENLMIAIVKDKTPVRVTEAALRESERLYRTLFEAADDAIGLFTLNREIILINSAFHQTLGYSMEEYVRLDLTETIHPDDRQRLAEMEQVLQREGIMAVEYRARHKEGYYLHMSSKNVLIRGEGEDKDLILSIIRDITERIKDIRELELAKERAEESDHLKSAFLANMSHEIRTPMNSIVGFSNLLVNPSLEDKTRELYVNRIVRNSELLLALITDIIDLAKIESGQLSIIYGKLEVAEMIAELEQYAADELTRLEIDTIQVSSNVELEKCELETDVIRIAQVMKNLINNAIKFTEKGSITIGCRKADNDQNIILYVEDSGIGIAVEHFDLIFEQFRQIDGSNTRKFGGTGLGLAICKNLVRLMGGRIWVESDAGKGALFQVELPLRGFTVTPPEPVHPTVDMDALRAQKSLQVMVVDDEPDALELLTELLTTMGHQVITAGSGYDALKLLDQLPLPDLVLLDVQMPVLSGTDTLRLIKERYRHLRVVAQSAHALVGDRDRFLEEGYDEYLPKPFSVDQLTGVISSLFRA